LAQQSGQAAQSVVWSPSRKRRRMPRARCSQRSLEERRMREVKYGVCGHMFDPDLNRQIGRLYEQQEYDFIIWSDQMCLTIPRSLWTPDLVPAAAVWDIDTFMATWPLMTDVAIHT